MISLTHKCDACPRTLVTVIPIAPDVNVVELLRSPDGWSLIGTRMTCWECISREENTETEALSREQLIELVRAATGFGFAGFRVSRFQSNGLTSAWRVFDAGGRPVPLNADGEPPRSLGSRSEALSAARAGAAQVLKEVMALNPANPAPRG